jgi:hypothetical protein
LSTKLQPPFYRLHLRPGLISDQHQSLLSLEQAGNEVFYVAPGFHTTIDLNSAYTQRQVWARSFRVLPSSIGPLPDDKPHHVTFQQPMGKWLLYSEEPSKDGRALETEDVAVSLQSGSFCVANERCMNKLLNWMWKYWA